MTRTPKHRFDAEEAVEAFALLSLEEKDEYDAINLSGGISTGSNARLRKLETLAYSRLEEEKNGKV